MPQDQPTVPGPRRHHYLPQFYLAGFTREGTREGRLHVISLRDGRRWQGTPTSIGHQRDFYRIEGVDGIDPNELERIFSDLEGGGASAVRHIVQTNRLPDDREQHSFLVNFIALMAARVPQMRENLGRPLRQVYEKIWRIQLSSRERFDELLAQARTDGQEIPDVDYETLRDAFENERIRIEVTQGQHLLTLLTIASTCVFRPS